MREPTALRILVVEDDPDTRANLSDLLELDGYDVVPAETAAAALDRRDWRSYGAILLDWKLPDASAETLLPELRRLAPDAAVIVSTGVGGLNEAVAAIRNGATDYITKPIDPDLLRASLRRIAHERQLTADKVRSEAAFRHLVEAAGSLIVILHGDGRILYMNPATEADIGRKLDDVRDMRYLDLCIAPEQHEPITRLLQQCLAEGRPVETEQSLISHDGTRHWVVWNIRPFGEDADEPILLAIGTDFTARREAEGKLLQAERLAAIGKAMTGLAHESRNALQRAQANLELLTLYVEDQPEAREIVQRLQATQSDLYHLYEEVRQYAAPLNIRAESQPLLMAVHEAWNLLSTERQGRDAAMSVIEEDVDDTCRIDRFQFVQAVRNILENSLTAANDPVRITVTFAADQLGDRPAVRMAIRDNGPGIPREQQSQVFDEFFTTRQRGTGLGLAIVKRIIEAHGGRVAVNPAVSEGTEILITVPRPPVETVTAHH